MLNHAELGKLMGLLGSVTKPFGQLKDELNSCFTKTQEKFRVASAMYAFCCKTSCSSCLSAYWFTLFPLPTRVGAGEAHLNPFFTVFLEGLQRDNGQLVEKRLLLSLLNASGSINNLSQMSANSVIEAEKKSVQQALNIPDLSNLKEKYKEQVPHVKSIASASVRPVILEGNGVEGVER